MSSSSSDTYFGQRLAFEMQKADHHIGHLDAGVVDVVLHIDLLSGGAQQAHEGVAENGVAQMADVRGLVGIDAGVLDQRMSRDLQMGPTGSASSAWMRHSRMRPIESRIDVPGAGDFESGESVDRAQRGHDLLRDDLRRLAQLARQFERDRCGQFAELQLRRNLQRECFRLLFHTSPAAHRECAPRAVSAIPDTRRRASEILDFQGRF